MSASEHLQTRQLRMFMTPREIVESGEVTGFSDLDPGYQVEAMLFDKLHEAKSGSPRIGKAPIYDSIREGGVQKPLLMGHGKAIDQQRLINGHHRLAVQWDLDKDQPIPIKHTSSGRERIEDLLNDEGLEP